MRSPCVAILALASAALGLPGCSRAPLPTPAIDLPSAGASSLGSDAGRGLLFVVDTPSSGGVLVYRQNGQNQQPFRRIQKDVLFPSAVWTDAHNNVWVANGGSESSGNKATIVRFPRRGTGLPDRILRDFGRDPTALWVGPGGAVYVVNDPLSANQRAEVVEYAPHEKTYTVIGDRKISHYITAVVGDAEGDLFVAGFTNSGVGEIDERFAGSKRWHDTGIAGNGRSVSQPWGLAFDADGNLVVVDYGNQQIETFPPNQTKPSNTIKCIPMDCTAIAFKQSGSRLWVGEPGYSTGTVDELEYPSGKFIESIGQTLSSPVSLATSPE